MSQLEYEYSISEPFLKACIAKHAIPVFKCWLRDDFRPLNLSSEEDAQHFDSWCQAVESVILHGIFELDKACQSIVRRLSLKRSISILYELREPNLSLREAGLMRVVADICESKPADKQLSEFQAETRMVREEKALEVGASRVMSSEPMNLSSALSMFGARPLEGE